MDGTQVTIVVGVVTSIVTLLTLIINIVNTNYKDARNRRWALEDKEELAKTTRHTVRDTGQALQLQFDEQRQMLDQIIRSGEERLLKILNSVDENTKISEKAFETANNVNEKIAAIGVQIRDQVNTVTAAPQEVLVVNTDPIEVTDKHKKQNAKPTRSV